MCSEGILAFQATDDMSLNGLRTQTLFFLNLQKCHAKGQKLKFDKINVWKIVSLLSLFR